MYFEAREPSRAARGLLFLPRFAEFRLALLMVGLAVSNDLALADCNPNEAEATVNAVR
jgi:hypothetical protein